MSDTKISALPAASAALGADELPINEAGASKKLTVAQIQALILAAVTGDTGWATPPGGYGWSNYGSGQMTVAYRKDGLGIVHLRGLITGGTGTMFNLPAGYRPSAIVLFAVDATGAFGDLRVHPNGDVDLDTGTGTYVSLDGVTFYAA